MSYKQLVGFNFFKQCLSLRGFAKRFQIYSNMPFFHELISIEYIHVIGGSWQMQKYGAHVQ